MQMRQKCDEPMMNEKERERGRERLEGARIEVIQCPSIRGISPKPSDICR